MAKFDEFAAFNEMYDKKIAEEKGASKEGGKFQEFEKEIKTKAPKLESLISTVKRSVSRYVESIRELEKLTPDSELEERIALDSTRRIAHNALMSNITALRRNAHDENITTESLPSTKNREEVTSWAIRLFNWMTSTN